MHGGEDRPCGILGWCVGVVEVEDGELGEELGCFLQPNESLPTAPWLRLRVVASLVSEHTPITKDGTNYG